MNHLEKIRQEVPHLPGCYIYYDENDIIIYIGKAKDLKKRMASYFNRANNTKTQHLVSKIQRFDYYITNNEKEALILENNLIKKHNPFYNIVLKDDKTYPYIYLTKEEHPILKKVRIRNLPGTYYGPYPSGTLVNKLIDYLNKKVPLRKCSLYQKEPCIYYHLGQCYGPCARENIPAEEIQGYVKQVDDYLKNNSKKLIKEISQEMYQLAEEMRFEKAQEYKEILNLLENLSVEQTVQFTKDISLDYLDYYKDDNFISLVILKIDQGKLINIHRSLIPYYKSTFEELSSYLYEYYQTKPQYYHTTDTEVMNIMENLLLIDKQHLNMKKQENLNNIAMENAREYYKNNIGKITKEFFTKDKDGYKELQQLTKDNLKRIEMFDISHIGGDAQVAGMIVYTNGKKDKKAYRKYKIKDINNLKDDYGSIREVLTRRFKKGIEINNLPNLLIIDGGKGQVSSAKEVLQYYGLENKIKLIGLSKDDKHTTKGIVNKNLEERIMDRKSELYKFLYELQEEVHRYAIDFHRQVKVKSLFQSELDNIEGIGPKRKKMLMEHFEYVENIKKATVKEFEELNLSKNIISNIQEYFGKKN
ncbi:MAG: excinuclease ABC subunit UvrC [Mycoplasmatales bacterium]